jgi:hypothetical protein
MILDSTCPTIIALRLLPTWYSDAAVSMAPSVVWSRNGMAGFLPLKFTSHSLVGFRFWSRIVTKFKTAWIRWKSKT